MVIALCALIGLIVGSFLNVVIWRLPRSQSVVSPPSACPQCSQRIRPYDNIPVLSWLLLRGRCRHCHTRISARYPLVETLTAALFAVTAWVIGPEVELIAFLYLAAISVALAMIDLDTHRLPNKIVLPGYIIAPALLTIATLVNGNWDILLRAALGAVILYAAYFLMVLVYPAGMGFGDVKLAGILGLYLGWCGWGALLIGGFAAFFFGGFYAIGLLLLRKANRKSGIPFGPWMILGAFFGIMLGQQLWTGYLSLFI